LCRRWQPILQPGTGPENKKLVNGSGLCFQLAQVFDNRDRAWLKEQFESVRQRELLILARVNDILNVAGQNVIPELETVIKKLSKQAKSIDNKVADAHGPPPRPTAEG
jgi:hypothetical protein